MIDPMRTPRRMVGTAPGCASGAWLDACEWRRMPGIEAIGGLAIHVTSPPPVSPAALADDAFAAGRAYERRRR